MRLNDGAIDVDQEICLTPEQAKTAARFGYEPMTDVGISTTGREWYQWWERVPRRQ